MASLWEMLGGGNFRDLSGQEDQALGFGDVLGQNRNSLALLGMGIASGGFAGGMKGLGVGTELDQQAAYRRAQQKQHQDDLAFRQSEAKRQAGQWQQTFQRGDVTEAQRAMRDVLGPDAAPQAKAEFMKSYYTSKLGGSLPAGWARTAEGGMTHIPGGPADPAYIASTKPGKELQAADRKAIYSAEDENAELETTVDALRRAKELNSKTFTGAGAGARGWLGSKLPDWVVPDVVADPKTAQATEEWQKTMSPEALKTMAGTLKGATTDFELRKFIEMLADPSTTPETRKTIIGRLETLAARKAQINQNRMDQLRGGTYFKPGGNVPAPFGPPATSGGDDGGGDPLAEARQAIKSGASRDAVIKRLRQNGVDPSGL